MLEIVNLSKSYGKKKALDQVSMKLENGLYGLLGPNGAGKSTLMYMITDNLMPDEGTISWEGEDIHQLGAEYRKILGYMPQQQGLYHGFTGRRFLHYMAALKDIPRSRIAEETERAAEYVNLQKELDKKTGSYSGGMKQRLLIAGAIIGSPRLLIFDEPTAGLDPKERVRVKHMLKKLSENRIVLLATHIVPDIEHIAEQVMILKNGVLLEKEKPEQLIEKYAAGGDLEDVYMNIFTDNQVEE
ncbi:MAG: ATP-binding cassette domain-containing protein [Lachnospiraceae bacterium]|nr:ATP-binding cassette domain-containing protein [Lachnospiraceae bacterium]